MSTTTVTDDMRLLGAKLQESFGDSLLGSREDRGELTFWVMPSVWVAACQLLSDEGFNHLSDLTAVDYLDREPRFDLMAILSSHQTFTFVRIKTVLDEDQSVETLTSLWTGANWFEREIFDLFGVNFEQHPDQRRILLPADYKGFPLRKDYPVTGPADSVFR